MISIDIEQLNKTSNEITSYIDSYEDTIINLYSKLKDATNDWHDPISIAFDETMITENSYSQNFLSELKLRQDIFSYTTDLYSNIGKKINCVFEQKESLINTLNNCISECTSIINEFNRIDNSFYYSEYFMILNQKAKVSDARSKLRSLKEKLTEKFQRISEYEEDIKSRIDELEPFVIPEYEFNAVELEKNAVTTDNYVASDLLSADIRNIDLYKDEENKDLTSIFTKYNEISNGYTSTNVPVFKADCQELRKNVDVLKKNRERYIQELESQILKYESMTIITKKQFKDKKDESDDKKDNSNGEDK